MLDNYDDVMAFHEKFVPDTIPDSPRMLPAELAEFRMKFMSEELLEFAVAQGRYDLPAAADALIDLVYVAMGTAIMMGLPWDHIWDAVHDANMRKLRTESPGASKRGSRYDVIKPAGWTPPNVAKIIDAYEQRMLLIDEERAAGGFLEK